MATRATSARRSGTFDDGRPPLYDNASEPQLRREVIGRRNRWSCRLRRGRRGKLDLRLAPGQLQSAPARALGLPPRTRSRAKSTAPAARAARVTAGAASAKTTSGWATTTTHRHVEVAPDEARAPQHPGPIPVQRGHTTATRTPLADCYTVSSASRSGGCLPTGEALERRISEWSSRPWAKLARGQRCWR